jgi:hypothetical protein
MYFISPAISSKLAFIFRKVTKALSWPTLPSIIFQLTIQVGAADMTHDDEGLIGKTL